MDSILWYGFQGAYQYMFPSSQRVMANDIRQIKRMLEEMQNESKKHYEPVIEIRKNVIATPACEKIENTKYESEIKKK